VKKSQYYTIPDIPIPIKHASYFYNIYIRYSDSNFVPFPQHFFERKRKINYLAYLQFTHVQ